MTYSLHDDMGSIEHEIDHFSQPEVKQVNFFIDWSHPAKIHLIDRIVVVVEKSVFFYFEQLNTQNWKHWRGGKMLVLILILFFSSIWFEIYSNTNTDNIFAKLVEKVSKLDFNWHYILYFKSFSLFCPSVKPSCAQFFVVFVIVSFGKF